MSRCVFAETPLLRLPRQCSAPTSARVLGTHQDLHVRGIPQESAQAHAGHVPSLLQTYVHKFVTQRVKEASTRITEYGQRHMSTLAAALAQHRQGEP